MTQQSLDHNTGRPRPQAQQYHVKGKSKDLHIYWYVLNKEAGRRGKCGRQNNGPRDVHI